METNPVEFTVNHTTKDDRLVVSVAGEIDLSTATDLQVAVDALSPFDRPIALDLSGVGFVDSTGIRALLAINNRAMETIGQPLILMGARESTRRLVELTGLDRILRLEE